MRFTVLAIINILMIIIGIITVSVSISYLPSTGGTVPQEMTLEQFQAQQHQALLKSTAFNWVIVGCCITATGILMALVRIYVDNRRETQRYNNTVLPLQVQASKLSPVKRTEHIAKPEPVDMAKPEPVDIEPLPKPIPRPELIHKSIMKYSTGALGPTGPRGPVVFHEPIPYRYSNNNIPDPKWYNYIPPRPVLKVKRGPIVEII
jgi:hypothetical protein